jgi:uncharacterized protein (DUF2336 family)
MKNSNGRYARLLDLSATIGSDERRAILREVTDSLGHSHHSESEFAELDGVLSIVAQEYSVEVRTQFARLVAASNDRFRHTAEKLAFDGIAVAATVLRQSSALTEETLLRVVAQTSQAHMMAVTQRKSLSPRLSHALVERGDDAVVTSLLSNGGAQIEHQTFEAVARRAEASPALQAPLVRHAGVPVDILHDLYSKVEADLRRDIIEKFGQVPPGELEKAFERSRSRVTPAYARIPEDFAAANKRVAVLDARKELVPTVLVSLMREGAGARTTFKLALSRLADVDFGVVDAAVADGDIDTLALLCRGSGFNRALFVTLAVGLDRSNAGMSRADEFGKLYETVPVHAAQRALRFWKVRTAG